MSQSSVESELHERRLSAILAADVAGYSRLMGADEEGTVAALKAHRKTVVDPAIANHRGRIVKTTGDGMLMEFASAVDAVRCAVDIQRSIAERSEAVPPPSNPVPRGIAARASRALLPYHGARGRRGSAGRCSSLGHGVSERFQSEAQLFFGATALGGSRMPGFYAAWVEADIAGRSFRTERSAVAPSLLVNENRDLIGNDRRLVQEMARVGEHQLQSVRSWRERDDRLGLAAEVMAMFLVHWDRTAAYRRIGVNEQMMVTCSLCFVSGRRDAHVGHAKLH
jgi:hypothetical protein